MVTIGNITLRGKPSTALTGICSKCKEECEERIIDASFSDSFGHVEDWESDGSYCCGAEICQGNIYLDQTTFHVARRDHKDGYIKKGDRYRKDVKKGYYIDEDGKHHGIFKASKMKICGS